MARWRDAALPTVPTVLVCAGCLDRGGCAGDDRIKLRRGAFGESAAGWQRSSTKVGCHVQWKISSLRQSGDEDAVFLRGDEGHCNIPQPAAVAITFASAARALRFRPHHRLEPRSLRRLSSIASASVNIPRNLRAAELSAAKTTSFLAPPVVTAASHHRHRHRRERGHLECDVFRVITDSEAHRSSPALRQPSMRQRYEPVSQPQLQLMLRHDLQNSCPPSTEYVTW